LGRKTDEETLPDLLRINKQLGHTLRRGDDSLATPPRMVRAENEDWEEVQRKKIVERRFQLQVEEDRTG